MLTPVVRLDVEPHSYPLAYPTGSPTTRHANILNPNKFVIVDIIIRRSLALVRATSLTLTHRPTTALSRSHAVTPAHAPTLSRAPWSPVARCDLACVSEPQQRESPKALLASPSLRITSESSWPQSRTHPHTLSPTHPLTHTPTFPLTHAPAHSLARATLSVVANSCLVVTLEP